MPGALLAGASGLVGGHCLRLLLEEPAYERVTVLVRRLLPEAHPRLEQRVVEFDHLAATFDCPPDADVFCCLGTTIKQAGSRPAFSKVDFTYVRELARLAAERGAEQFLLVSALGANAHSRIFYSRVKGQVEGAVRELGFTGVHIFRPSLLVGERPEHRPGERLGIALAQRMAFALVGPLRKYRPIQAETVAAAMVRVARRSTPGVHVYESDRIAAIGA